MCENLYSEMVENNNTEEDDRKDVWRPIWEERKIKQNRTQSIFFEK